MGLQRVGHDWVTELNWTTDVKRIKGTNGRLEKSRRLQALLHLWDFTLCYEILSSMLLFSRSVVSNSLQPHGLQHARLPCPSLSPGVCSNSCPLSWWWHPTSHLCWPLLLPPSVFPSVKVFSNELALHIRWPKYWSFSICPSNEYSGSIPLGFIGLMSL